MSDGITGGAGPGSVPSEQRVFDLARMLEDSLNEIYVFDQTSLRFVVVNRSARNNLGYSMDELERLTPVDIKAQFDEETFRRLVAPVGSGARERLSFETEHTRKDGSVYPVEVHLQAGRYGELPVFTAIILDITERRQAEEERRAFEAQLRQVQKLESLGLLAGGIAHDFNNILTGILGHAQQAGRELVAGGQARVHLERVVQGAQRAAELTGQMLAYSGKGHFVVRALDVAEIIRDMRSLLEVSVSKRVALGYDFVPHLPAIEADATQLRQVIMNLVINASEAIGDESGSIDVRVGARSCDAAYLSECRIDEELPEGRYVYVEVTDTGCGMSAETRLRLFDPFFSTKFTGRGLGLAATLGIVRGHRGAIKVTSELGGGTTFRVLFPVSQQAVSPAPAREAQDSDWRGSGEVLVVDDEEGVRDMARCMLEELGFKVRTAHDGRDGVRLFSEHHERLSLVLLDMTMPGLDGEQTFREMRRITTEVPTILSSGYSEQTTTGRFADEAPAGFIQKPYRIEQFQAVVRSVLHG